VTSYEPRQLPGARLEDCRKCIIKSFSFYRVAGPQVRPKVGVRAVSGAFSDNVFDPIVVNL